MKLSLMKNFFDSIDDAGRSPILDSITSKWFGSADTRIIRVSANFVAIVKNEGATYYLRFNHETERTVPHIKNELNYIQHLIEKGINANRPIQSRDCAHIESIDTDLGVFHAVLFTTIPGDHIELNDLDMAGFSKWGASLAEIHKASHGIELDGPVWSDQLDLLSKQVPDIVPIMREANSIRNKLSGDRVSRANYGLTVFDFEMDNIKWDGGCPGFMDFDDFCVHWYAADIAYALRDLYDDRVTKFNADDKRVQSFVEGYRTIRGISKEELNLIPVFIRLHNLYFYARIHRAISTSSDDPDWVKNLSKKLTEANESYLKDIIENPVT